MKSKDKRNIPDNLNEYDFKKLKIKFLNKDEIKIFSTLCQDGIFSIDEIIYNKSDKILIATFSSSILDRNAGHGNHRFSSDRSM